jgi:3-dehydroquinate synthase
MDPGTDRHIAMKTHPSSLGDIYTGPTNECKLALDQLEPSSIFILADENTAKFCVPRLEGLIEKSHLIVVGAGEQHKNLDSCQAIWSNLIDHNADRHSLMINVGGGMICDLGGFAASCFQRGIRFAHIPTTVLAMADAAFGGKTGVDFGGLKNYIGLFRVPVFVWIDEQYLKTLPQVERTSGLAEIVKHAIIGSEELWEMLNGITSTDHISWNPLFEKNLPVKMNIVEADPSERGIRKVLNFGHTIGHAIESSFLLKNHTIPHGNCIATGMLVEARIANSIGLLGDEDFTSIVKLIRELLEPVKISLPTFDELKDWIGMDKKKSGGLVGYSLPDRIGSCGWDIPVNEKVVEDSYHWFTQANAD